MRRTKTSKRDPEAAELQRAAMLAERARVQQERLQNQIRKASRPCRGASRRLPGVLRGAWLLGPNNCLPSRLCGLAVPAARAKGRATRGRSGGMGRWAPAASFQSRRQPRGLAVPAA